jgi:uncharacterized protein
MAKTKAIKGKVPAKATIADLANEITVEKLEKYLDITNRAIRKVKITESGKIDWKASAEDFFDMAKRYHSDAHYFMKKGDYVNAFAAVNYAHGWLDAGARLGMFDVDHDNKLFTVD